MSYKIDSYTKILLHFDGVDGSTTMTDLSGKTWTPTGDAQLDTAQKKFGTASLLLDGTGDYIQTPDSADFSVGSDDFTIDFWFKTSNAGEYLYAQSGDGGADRPFYGFVKVDGAISFSIYNAAGTRFEALSPSNGYADGKWHHYAGIRNGNNSYCAIDGILGTATDVTGVSAVESTYKFGIGSCGEYISTLYNGWFDEFRFSKGIARWTSNFNPDTTSSMFLMF